MNYNIIKYDLLEGFTGIDISTTKIVATMIITCIFALYIFIMYRVITRKTFYSKTFNISISIVAIISAGIVLSMQSSLVISLGMVGALSIVRFRTAIKEPLDLIFLFWGISIGIICGAGLYEVAFIMSVIVSIALLGFELLPAAKASTILVLHTKESIIENQVIQIVKKHTKKYQVKSRNITNNELNLIIEINTKEEMKILEEIRSLKNNLSVSILAHDGEVNF